jgi:alpha-glucosidase
MATYNAIICKDGINADRYAADYLLSDTMLQKNDVVKIHLAPGGGFVIKLTRK